MFDLDLIEEDWKNNSFRLSEEEIIELYRSENVTLRDYEERIDKYIRLTHKHLKLSAEERILRSVFGDQEDLKEQERKNKVIDEIPEPKKKRLSKEAQAKVVEGCLYMVFDETHGWYNFFNGVLSLETIYYICLDALMNSVKYMVHCEKPFFELYVSRSIERNIIKYVSKSIHISYRDAYDMIHWRSNFGRDSIVTKLSLSCEITENLEKPSKIFYQLKDVYYEINYIKNISSDEFMTDYNIALGNLDDIARVVMQLSFDRYGYRGLTNAEIADYLGIDAKRISNIRRRAIKTLRKDPKLNMYLH